MSWPISESEATSIPCGEFALGSWEVLTPEVEKALRRFLVPYHDELEALTNGSTKLEQTLGGLLVIAANYAANARQRELEGRPVL